MKAESDKHHNKNPNWYPEKKKKKKKKGTNFNTGKGFSLWESDLHTHY